MQSAYTPSDPCNLCGEKAKRKNRLACSYCKLMVCAKCRTTTREGEFGKGGIHWTVVTCTECQKKR